MSDNPEDLKDVPVSVGFIEVKGLKRTDPNLLQPLLSPCMKATTFGALSECLRSSMEKVQRLDIFKNINVVMDKMEDDAGHDVKVIIDAEEKRYRLHAGTESMSGQLFNVLGRAETLDASASFGRHTTSPFQVTLSKPISGDPDKVVKLSAGSLSSKYPSGLKYCHSSDNASIALKLPSWIPEASHELKLGFDWRTVHGLASDASPTLRRAAGHSLKSALSHSWTMDSRNDSVFPSHGLFARWNQEIAGGPLGGDANHVKQDLFASAHAATPKLPSVILSASFHMGHLLTLAGKQSFLLDRFQMGGPTSLRGFESNLVGPRDQTDPLGGDFALEAGLNLSFPIIPSLGHVMRAHVFTNAGMISLNQNGTPFSGVRELLANPKPHISAGAGLLFKLSPTMRLELNLAYPLRNPTDSPTSSRGLQLGIGVEFL